MHSQTGFYDIFTKEEGMYTVSIAIAIQRVRTRANSYKHSIHFV